MVLKFSQKPRPDKTKQMPKKLLPHEILQECCANKSAGLIFSISAAAVANATFLDLDVDKVKFVLHDTVPFRPMTLCCVSFTVSDRAHVFISRVEETDYSGAPAHVSFDIPAEICVAEMRSIFRVPVVESCNLACSVGAAGARSEPNVEDISMKGICLRFDSDVAYSTGDLLQVELNKNENRVSIAAEVRNVQQNRVGALFLDDKSDALSKLVRDLEIDYIRREKQQTKNAPLSST